MDGRERGLAKHESRNGLHSVPRERRGAAVLDRGHGLPDDRGADLCYGAPSSSGAQVVITGADGRVLTLSLNGAGNFFSEMAVAKPYHAKVVTAEASGR